MRGANGLRCGRAGLGFLLILAATSAPGADELEPGDERTFRPTVLIRKGPAQGSGTIIYSVEGETLVLTAAHVVEERGPLRVELHRYNLGIEARRARGTWPRRVPAEVAAADPAADVAVLRIRNMVALPYVARVAPKGVEPAPGTVVSSVGIDLGTRLSGWSTRVSEAERFRVEGTRVERRFLITTEAPEHGRSGGGLFLENGDLVGVCVGRTQFADGEWSGIFASGTSVRRVLRDLDSETTAGRTAPPTRRAPITNTRARSPR